MKLAAMIVDVYFFVESVYREGSYLNCGKIIIML